MSGMSMNRLGLWIDRYLLAVATVLNLAVSIVPATATLFLKPNISLNKIISSSLSRGLEI